MIKRSQHSRPYKGPSSNFRQPATLRVYNASLRQLGSNERESFRLNQLAADEGMHDAVLAMGWFYLNGVGVEADEAAAYQWYRKSARQGDARAMFSLGQLAYWERDFAEAMTWFARASEKDHQRARFWIGKMHWRGQGVERDRRKALRFFTEAAASRVEEAQRTIRYLNYLRSLAMK